MRPYEVTLNYMVSLVHVVRAESAEDAYEYVLDALPFADDAAICEAGDGLELMPREEYDVVEASLSEICMNDTEEDEGGTR